MAKAEPERSCIVTREPRGKDALIRFVVSPEGVLVADLASRLPGRGVYVSNSRKTVEKAIVQQAFARAMKSPVSVPDGFVDTLQQLLLARVAEALSLARKAGQVITGFDKINDALHKGSVAALVHASDASEEGIKKLKREGIPTFRSLPREALSQVLDRENAVHVAVLDGPAAAFFIETARRFTLFIE